MAITAARQASLNKRGAAIAQRSLRRAERHWKLLSGAFRVDMTFEEFLLRRGGRITGLAGLRILTSFFSGEEQTNAAKIALQRLLDERFRNRLQVEAWVVAPVGFGAPPVWQTGWSVKRRRAVP